MECIKRLEQRIDNLEDYSRRDNLLFYGFTEQFNEDCTERVQDLICKKILANNVNAAEIKFVRAHRLGKFNGSGAKPRPIIVKFREFSDKMKVFMSKKHLKNSPYVVTEDFSANTNSQREFLQDCINEAKTNLGDTMDAGFLRYFFLFKTFITSDTVSSDTALILILYGDKSQGMSGQNKPTEERVNVIFICNLKIETKCYLEVLYYLKVLKLR